MTTEELVTITVDGKEIRAPKGTLLWEACQANGIDIPIFCYHTKLGPVGACRTCLVQVEGARPPKDVITACSTPVTDGMKIRARSPVVEQAQRGIMEFLLLNHPLDCPICDRGGECPLQDQTFAYGPGASRYVEPKRHHVKPIVLGPTIALDRERCVLCWRCVRFCAEIAEDKSIVLLDRGQHTVVGTYEDEPYVSNFSGNVVELCPVGALTSRKQRFNFRPWELANRPSICPHCPMGCNINVSVRKNDEVIRFLSRDNPAVDGSWLCDRGRYNFEFVNSPERITSPLLRQGNPGHEGGGYFAEVSWPEAFDFIATRLNTILAEDGPDAVAGVASPRLTNEDLFVFKRFMTDCLGSANFDHYPRPQMPLTSGQREAARRLDAQLMAIDGLDQARTILLLGADPSQREPVMELRVRLAVNRQGARLVVVNSDEINLTSKANATLRYAPGALAEMARALAKAVSGGAGVEPEVARVATTYLAEGSIAVLYDDSFPEVTDRGDALAAVDELVAALVARAQGHAAAGHVGVIPMLDDCNSMGARDLGIVPPGDMGPWTTSTVSALLRPDSPIRAAILLGANLVRAARQEPGQNVEAALQRLRRLDLLVVSELFMTETATLADVILPAASFAEKRGTFTNTERRVQLLTQTVPSPGVARADWETLVDLSQYLDRPLPYSMPEQIWNDIRQIVPPYANVSYVDIGGQGIRATGSPAAAALQPV